MDEEGAVQDETFQNTRVFLSLMSNQSFRLQENWKERPGPNVELFHEPNHT